MLTLPKRYTTVINEKQNGLTFTSIYTALITFSVSHVYLWYSIKLLTCVCTKCATSEQRLDKTCFTFSLMAMNHWVTSESHPILRPCQRVFKMIKEVQLVHALLSFKTREKTSTMSSVAVCCCSLQAETKTKWWKLARDRSWSEGNHISQWRWVKLTAVPLRQKK